MRSRRNLSIALIVLVLYVIQTTVIASTHWWLLGPDLVILAVLSWTLVLSQTEAAVVSFVAGLFLDVAPPADGAIGRWALVLTLVSLVLWPIATSERVDSPLISMGLVALASSVVVAGLFLVDAITSDERMHAGPLAKAIVGVGLWNLLLAPFVLPVVQKIARRQSAVLL